MGFWEELFGPSEPLKPRRRMLVDFGYGCIREYIVEEETETAYRVGERWLLKDDKRIKEVFWK